MRHIAVVVVSKPAKIIVLQECRVNDPQGMPIKPTLSVPVTPSRSIDHQKKKTRWLALWLPHLEQRLSGKRRTLTHDAHDIFTFHAVYCASVGAFVLQGCFLLRENVLASGVHHVHHMSKVFQGVARRPVHHFVPPI